MIPESDLLSLSGLQHMVFCERQWGLIHIEQQWAENRLTAEGRLMHERSDRPEVEVRGPVRIVRSLRLRSLQLGLAGIADVVEFHRDAPELHSDETPLEILENEPVVLPGQPGHWRPFPVEYKRGRPKKDDSDRVQLAAQAMCLEEMLGGGIQAAALFYGNNRRRHPVTLDAALRDRVNKLAARMHELFVAGRTPVARYEPKCDNCSLLELCRPKSSAHASKSASYLMKQLRELG